MSSIMIHMVKTRMVMVNNSMQQCNARAIIQRLGNTLVTTHMERATKQPLLQTDTLMSMEELSIRILMNNKYLIQILCTTSKRDKDIGKRCKSVVRHLLRVSEMTFMSEKCERANTAIVHWHTVLEMTEEELQRTNLVQDLQMSKKEWKRIREAHRMTR